MINIGFAKCNLQDKECPKKSTCKRYIGDSNPEWQSYVDFFNICGEFNKYKWYWEVNAEIIIKEDNNPLDNQDFER